MRSEPGTSCSPSRSHSRRREMVGGGQPVQEPCGHFSCPGRSRNAACHASRTFFAARLGNRRRAAIGERGRGSDARVQSQNRGINLVHLHTRRGRRAIARKNGADDDCRCGAGIQNPVAVPTGRTLPFHMATFTFGPINACIALGKSRFTESVRAWPRQVKLPDSRARPCAGWGFGTWFAAILKRPNALRIRGLPSLTVVMVR